LENFGLKDHELILFDSSTLIGMHHGNTKKLKPLRILLSEWKRLRIPKIGCIPDFIEEEAVNVEEHKFGNRYRIRRFLKRVEKGNMGFYVKLETPKEIYRRKRYIKLLPETLRRAISDEFYELSSTDISLLIVGFYLHNNGVKTAILSSDAKLLEAAKRFKITPYTPTSLCDEIKSYSGEVEALVEMRVLAKPENLGRIYH
jgi:hypothetical protein